jgi:hypothetical protein
MRRIVLASVLALTSVLVAAPAAQAIRYHVYRGRTSIGGSVKVVTSGGGPRLHINSVGMGTPGRTWECPPGEDAPFRGLTFGWPGDGRPIGDDRTFSKNILIDGYIDFHLQGTVMPQVAEGTFEVTWFESGCTTGALTWQAHRTDRLTRVVAMRAARSGWRVI